MTCSNESADEQSIPSKDRPSNSLENPFTNGTPKAKTMVCPSCGHPIRSVEKEQDGIHNLPGLPAGVKFDPSDQELLEHLEAKVEVDAQNLHPLIDEFIQTLEGKDGICYTHPDKLPGLAKDGIVRHFFHRPSKAYTTGTRKRRKVHTNIEGNETRWHKTGKTRPIVIQGKAKGYKKILVLYTNYGKQSKPEKTNWVMHQYHLGDDEDEKEGELVISKVFYQTQPRQCASLIKDFSIAVGANGQDGSHLKESTLVESFNPTIISFDQCELNRPTPRFLSNFNIP